MALVDRLKFLKLKNTLIRECISEFMGTFCLVFIGNCGIINSQVEKFLDPLLTYSLAIMVAVYTAGGTSGGHVNPAVTLAFVCLGRCDKRKALPFMAAQYLGAFVASAATHLLFYDRLHVLDSDSSTLGIVFATYASPHVTLRGAILDQLIGTAMLMFIVMTVVDEKNMQVPKCMVPIALALGIYGLLGCMSSNTGAALNPARDLAPRIYSYLIGYEDAFTRGGKEFSNFFWIPVVMCYIGAVLGALVYYVTIEVHFNSEEVPAQTLVESSAQEPLSAHHINAPTSPHVQVYRRYASMVPPIIKEAPATQEDAQDV